MMMVMTSLDVDYCYAIVRFVVSLAVREVLAYRKDAERLVKVVE